MSTATTSGNTDYTFKVLLIGDAAVGKSSINGLTALVLTGDQSELCFAPTATTENIFTDAHISNLGVDFKTKTKTVNGIHYKLQIWDTAGQERFRTMTSSFYRGAQGVIVVFDCTKVESFTNVRRWFDEVERNACEDLVQVLCASKVDLEEQRRVSTSEGKDKAAELGFGYHETSAKNNTGIDAMFDDLIASMKDSVQEASGEKTSVNVNAAVQKKKKKCII